MKRPNILIVFADQWRAQAFGYAGNRDVQTPNIDRFSAESANLVQATSSCPLCSPYRASLITGQRPLTHGVFINDVPVRTSSEGFGNIFKELGYDTAFIGKWHINGYGRTAPIPKDRRFGFDYWKVLECSHDYTNSAYYDHDSTELSYWEGYDAYAQTEDALTYMELHQKEDSNPFLLFLSWGPPHAPPPYLRDSPYDKYPEDVEGLYHADTLTLQENVPAECDMLARRLLEGYYSHCTALDTSFGRILEYLQRFGMKEETIILFTSDHGDMLGSHGLWKKQVPFEESTHVPFLLRAPKALRIEPGEYPEALIEPEDILPTMLGLIGENPPSSVEGKDYSAYLQQEETLDEDYALLAVYQTGGQWGKGADGGPFGYTGREYRGIKTTRFTYVIDKNGPWLLYDTLADPLQHDNLVGRPEVKEQEMHLHVRLQQILAERGDDFLGGDELASSYGYTIEYAKSLNSQETEIYLSNWGYALEGSHHE